MAKCPVCGIRVGTEEEGSYHAFTPHNKSKAEQERVARNVKLEARHAKREKAGDFAMDYSDDTRCGNCGRNRRKPGFVNCEACMRKAEEASKAKATDSARRARLHSALDAVLSKDANKDGTISPDEDKCRADLVKKAYSTVLGFKNEAYAIGGNFRGPGIWAQVRAAIASVGR